MKNKWINNSLITLIIISLIGCSGKLFNLFDDKEVMNNEYSLRALPYNELYYTYLPVYYDIYPPFDYTTDDSNIVVSRYHDLYYYNPVDICLKAINLYDRYVNVKDSVYLEYALKYRDKLITLMDENYLFEYRMNYLHFDILLMDPWYSGMAQGLALSLLSRLGYYAQDSLSVQLAHQVYQTLNPFSELSKEVVDIDKNKYIWIEEYPGNPPDRTFNGFMHAIIGIYDYYHLINSDEEIASILSSYLTTIHDHMFEFRNPDNISFYCLRHHHLDRTYHKIHVRQLNLFTNITQDSSFMFFGDTLKKDYWDW